MTKASAESPSESTPPSSLTEFSPLAEYSSGRYKSLGTRACRAIWWKLGPDKWKEVIDGEYHHLGPLTYDLCLHKDNEGKPEKGYLNSMKNGWKFIDGCFGRRITVKDWLACHKIVCAHFQGKAKTGTEIKRRMAGRIRSEGWSVRQALFDEYEITPAGLKDIESLKPAIVSVQHRRAGGTKWKRFEGRGVSGATSDSSTSEHSSREYRRRAAKAAEKKKQQGARRAAGGKGRSAAAAAGAKRRSRAKLRVAEEEQEEEEQQEEDDDSLTETEDLTASDVSSTAEATDTRSDVRLRIKSMKRKRIRHYFEHYLSELYHKLRHAQSQEEKLRAICRFHQLLEWLHVAPDGTGRTNTLFFNKLLIENGFHPPLLIYPMQSDNFSLDEWVELVRDGFVRWEEAVKDAGTDTWSTSNLKAAALAIPTTREEERAPKKPPHSSGCCFG